MNIKSFKVTQKVNCACFSTVLYKVTVLVSFLLAQIFLTSFELHLLSIHSDLASRLFQSTLSI